MIMKKWNLGFVVMVLLLSNACKQKSSNPITNPTGNVSIHFNHQVGGSNLVQGEMIYTNQAGNMYSIDLLKYFVTNIILVKDDGHEFKLKNYDLINAFDPNFLNIDATNVPNGNYTAMKFLVGIDKVNNQTAGTGDLDPRYNMSWSWNFGYIFFKHEGTYKNTIGVTEAITQHLGTDEALMSVNIPITLNVLGNNKIMNLVFDLNKMYNSPAIDFNVDGFRMSAIGDETWMANMVSNINDVFSFKNVE
jgi:hypothetical protein